MEAKLSISTMRGYPNLPSTDKINTLHFLNASREVVAAFESFGKLFKPVVYDMNGNIEKIHKHYLLDKNGNLFLDDMVADDAKNKRLIVEPLLWLKRNVEPTKANKLENRKSSGIKWAKANSESKSSTSATSATSAGKLRKEIDDGNQDDLEQDDKR
ncbi:glycolipid transfer protein [Sergentomyia squamirostris]